MNAVVIDFTTREHINPEPPPPNPMAAALRARKRAEALGYCEMATQQMVRNAARLAESGIPVAVAAERAVPPKDSNIGGDDA